jgi:hypothetical protein
MGASPPRVFISYSQDSTQHKDLVLRFAERLRKDGIDAQIDQYVKGRPPGGWPRWMLDKLDWAEFVLLACTETYYRRFRGHEEPGKGKGVDWEGQLITFEIYQAKSRTTKFVPVIFGSQNEEFIPEPLRDHRYRVDSEESYQELYAFLTGQAGVPLAELGAVKALPRKEVEPLTFDGPDEKTPLTGKIEGVSERSSHHSPREPDQPPLRRKRRQPSSQPSRDNVRRGDQWSKIAPYAVVSLVSFLCGVGILALMLWNVQTLVAFGLTGNLYYIVLLPLGLAAAAFLFGLLQSHAVYSGHTGWGRLELGGSIVGCALVVVGGFYLVPNPLPFAVTVFVHGEGGIHDLVPKDSGEVVMELGGKVQRQQIGPDGTVDFKDIGPSHRGEAAPLWFESKQFESVRPEQKYALKGDIQLEVRKKGGKISGRVQDENGKPLSGAKIEVAGLSTTTNSAGHFEFTIPGDRLQPSFDLMAEAAGYSVRHYEAVPNANELVIALAPEK